MQTPRTEFAQALRAIATERNLDPEVILDTIKQAIVAAYKRDARERGEETDGFDYDVVLDPVSGEAKVFAWPCEIDEEGNRTEKLDERKDVTPPGFGRIAAQTAKQVIHQKIKEAEKGAIMDEFSGRVGALISGMVLRFDGPNVRVDLGKTEGLMMAEDRIPNEKLSLNQRLSFLLKDILETPRGKQITLSRADSLFVQKLFEREVPEIGSGGVVVKSIARDPGVRTKIVVASSQSGVDPVGSCVGQKGVRVQAVTNELGGERVDIIPWTESKEDLIAASLSPAEGLVVTIDSKANIAHVKAPEDQLSLAIGRDGQNVKLASQIAEMPIDIQALEGTHKEEVKDGVVEEKSEKIEKVIEEVATVPTEVDEIVSEIKSEEEASVDADKVEVDEPKDDTTGENPEESSEKTDETN